MVRVCLFSTKSRGNYWLNSNLASAILTFWRGNISVYVTLVTSTLVVNIIFDEYI